MKGYLLDTCAVSEWLDSTKPGHSAISERIRQLAAENAVLFTSAVVLGEIRYGIEVAEQERSGSLHELWEQIDIQFVRNRLLLDVTLATSLEYGRLRAGLFEKYAPAAKPHSRRRRAEELLDPATSRELGIQENDLWIAAQAMERNLVLLSNDKMARIREIAPDLQTEGWVYHTT